MFASVIAFREELCHVLVCTGEAPDTTCNVPLLLNSFRIEVSPISFLLPYADFPSWEESTAARDSQFSDMTTWRYSVDENQSRVNPSRNRMVFLNGPETPKGTESATFDLGRFWRIGCLSIEDSLGAHFSKFGYEIERNQFERIALTPHHGSVDGSVELATGLSFSVRRPFHDEPYGFTATFQWVVRAFFRDTLENDSLARIALGMPVLYKPSGAPSGELRRFTNRFLGRIRSIEGSKGIAVVLCKDEAPRSVRLVDLRLEASPGVIKTYEKQIRSRSGPSSIIRTIQQLKLSLTKDNRRNITALRDRLERIRSLLLEVGSSRDQLVVPLASFQSGSISMGLAPQEPLMGEPW
jgi:hypothetical protein